MTTKLTSKLTTTTKLTTKLTTTTNNTAIKLNATTAKFNSAQNLDLQTSMKYFCLCAILILKLFLLL